jgi:hypothetical protein
MRKSSDANNLEFKEWQLSAGDAKRAAGNFPATESVFFGHGVANESGLFKNISSPDWAANQRRNFSRPVREWIGLG